MTLTNVELDATFIADATWAEIAATPSVDDWLRLICGVRPGVSFPRRGTGPVHPSCLATAGWLQALWGYGT